MTDQTNDAHVLLPTDLESHFSRGAHQTPPGTRWLTRDQAVEEARALADAILLGRSMGLVPLTDSNDSNPYCYITTGLARGRILHLMHDGDTGIRFDDLTSFSSMLDGLATGGRYIDDLRPAVPTPHADQAELAHHCATLSDRDNDESLCELIVLIPLIDPGKVDLLQALASNADFFVREAVAMYIEARPSVALTALAQALARDTSGQVASAGKSALRACRGLATP